MEKQDGCKNIAAKLVKIMKECSHIAKDKKNTHYEYSYVSAEAILSKVNSACVENNIASITNYKLIDKEEIVNKNKTRFILLTVQCDLTIIDADSGETLTVTALGTGQDTGDKSVAKAQTMALKYAWMTTLNISTGDDPEKDEYSNEPQQFNPDQSNQNQPFNNGNYTLKGMSTEKQQKKIHIEAEKKGYNTSSLVLEKFGIGSGSTKELTKQQASDLISWLIEAPPAQAEGQTQLNMEPDPWEQGFGSDEVPF